MPVTDEQYEQLQKELAVCEENEIQLSSDLEAQVQQNAALKRSLADAEDASAKHRAKVVELQAELERYRTEAKNATEQLKDVKAKNVALSNDVERCEKLLRKAEFDVDRLRREAEEATERAIIADTAVDDEREIAKTLRGELLQARQQLEEVQSALASARKNATAAQQQQQSDSTAQPSSLEVVELQKLLGRLKDVAQRYRDIRCGAA